MTRRAAIGAAVGVVLLGALGFWLFQSLDARVAREIEAIGSRLTGTAVTVGRVDLTLSEGRGTVRNLRIANPAGFSSDPLLTIGELTLDLEATTIGSVPVVLSEVRLLAPHVRVELDETGRSNVAVLLARLDGGSDPAPAPEAEPLRLRIERFRFEEGRIELAADAAEESGEGETRMLNLPGLRVAQLGAADGLPPGELGRRLLLRYLGHVAAVAAKDATFRFLEQKADELGDHVGEAAKGILRVLRGDSGAGADAPEGGGD